MIGFEHCVLCGAPARDRCDCDRETALRRLHGHLCGAVLHLEAAERIAAVVPIVAPARIALTQSVARLNEVTPDYGQAEKLAAKGDER